MLPGNFVALRGVNPYSSASDFNPIALRAHIIEHIEPYTGPYLIIDRDSNTTTGVSKMITDGTLLGLRSGGTRIVHDGFAEVMTKIAEAE